MESIRIDFSRIDWDTRSAGMRVKRAVQQGKQVRLVEIGPDTGEADWCEVGHVGYVLEREIETSFDGAVERLTAGDGLVIPGGKKYRHKSKAINGTVRLLLVDDD